MSSSGTGPSPGMIGSRSIMTKDSWSLCGLSFGIDIVFLVLRL